MNDGRRGEVLLALQQALLGEVTARLRAVVVTCSETSFHFNAYVDGPIQDDDREAMSLVETEVMAVFPSNHTISHEVFRLDAPALIPKDRDWVYYRKE